MKRVWFISCSSFLSHHSILSSHPNTQSVWMVVLP